MKVFVLAPIYNRKETTLNFLKSFSNQTYKDYQMVIIDDGSTDGSSEAILAEFPKTIILKGDGNLWWTRSMNKGLEYILSVAEDNDYVLAINDDVTVKNNYIEKLVFTSKENEDAIVGSIYRDIENEDIIYDSGVKIDWKRYIYYQVKYDKDKKFIDDVDTLATRGTLILIKIVKDIGIFERKLRHYGADYEYFFRAKKFGHKLVFSCEAAVYGVEKNSLNSDNDSRIRPFFTVWKKVFGIKSSANIFNHLFLIWSYCPSSAYKMKHSGMLIAYDAFLFLNSIFLYPFAWLYHLVVENKNKK